MSRFRSLRFRFAALCLASVLLTTVALLTVVQIQQRSLLRDVSDQLSRRAEAETGKVAADVYVLCRTMQNALQSQINGNLNVARHVLAQRGEVSFGKEEVPWRAVNQLNRQEQAVRLPKLLVGGQWLGQNSDTRAATPVIDEVQGLVGGTVTLFQRMNEQGDMLRVATTVLDDKSQRAIGTFIPAKTTQGEPNPVIANVLAGNRFQGRAFVVNAWYITGYEPLFDAVHRVIGMIYVGVRQDLFLKPVHEGLISLVVGRGGYVWSAGASGDQKGVFAISPRGARDGENALQSKDPAEREAYQMLLTRGRATRDGAVDFVRQEVIEGGRSKLVVTAVTYFEPWDWVIGATAYQDDFSGAMVKVNEAGGSIVRWSLGAAALILIALFLIATIALRRLAKPLQRLVHATEAIAAGDLRQSVELSGEDEIGQVARAFDQMVTKMREIASGLHESVGALNTVVTTLGNSASEQNQAITRQAAALQETQVTAQEIKQTSLMAAQKAEAVLQVTARADEASRSGEKAIEQSMSGLIEIREQVDGIALKIKNLGGKTRQIGSITGSVKDLADQSNMLALNAAIEAVRSGEHGKGFAVVAREVRTLADQSIQATERVREILQDVSEAITVAVAISEKGVEKMEGGMTQVKASGENLHQLGAIVQETLAAVRQIAAAVSQQNAGIGQIFTAGHRPESDDGGDGQTAGDHQRDGADAPRGLGGRLPASQLLPGLERRTMRKRDAQSPSPQPCSPVIAPSLRSPRTVWRSSFERLGLRLGARLAHRSQHRLVEEDDGGRPTAPRTARAIATVDQPDDLLLQPLGQANPAGKRGERGGWSPGNGDVLLVHLVRGGVRGFRLSPKLRPLLWDPSMSGPGRTSW